MLTYIPICLVQGTATRSAVRATPRQPVKVRAAPTTSPKSKTTTVFHLLKVKGEFMSIHRISCFRLSKASNTEVQASNTSNPNNQKENDIIKRQPTTPINCRGRVKSKDKEKDVFSTPLDQIRDVENISSKSRFSDITTSTIHENFEEYKRQNSSAGFWSPALSDTPRLFMESGPQSLSKPGYPSLADASRSQQAKFYKQYFEAKRFMVNNCDRILEDFLNNILATLAAMFPPFTHELLTMRDTILADLLDSKILKEGLRESETLSTYDHNGIHNTDIKTRTEVKNNASDEKQTIYFLENIIELYKQRTKILREEIEDLTNEKLAERYEEHTWRKLAIQKQKNLMKRIEQLESSLEECQMKFRVEKYSRYRQQNRSI